MYIVTQKYSDTLRSVSRNYLKCNLTSPLIEMKLTDLFGCLKSMFTIKDDTNYIKISCTGFWIHYGLCLEVTGIVISSVLYVLFRLC